MLEGNVTIYDHEFEFQGEDSTLGVVCMEIASISSIRAFPLNFKAKTPREFPVLQQQLDCYK
jgi:hypothetical protein